MAISLKQGLYLVTPDQDDTEALLAATAQALQGGAVLVQYRHKQATPALRLIQARALLDLCRSHGVPFVINDHLDLCLEIGADGLHVGGTDATVASVRAALGPDRIVGASCYGDLELARQSVVQGASYVAFGGFYPSRVKKYAVTTPLSIIGDARASLPVPVVVIGGMTAENAAPLVHAGADMVAAISSVYGAADVRQAARAFAALYS